MKVLVTGAAGFFGSHIVRKLVSEGIDVIGVDLPSGYAVDRLKGMEGKARFITADITQPSFQERVSEPLDVILHLAAIAAPLFCDKYPGMTFDLNVGGTHNVLKLALKCEAKKVIFASTAHVYGISPKYLPTDERHPLWLQDNYTASKILGEHLCQLYYDNHGLDYLTLRVYNGYGPGQTAGYFIPDMIKKALGGRIDLKGADVTKDFIFISDIVSACVKAMTSQYTGAINIGSGREVSLRYAADYIANAFGASFTESSAGGAGPTRMLCDRNRALRVLGWKPEVGFEEGLDRTIKSWK